MKKDIRIGIRLDVDTRNACKSLAPEGNISLWIRMLILTEIEKNNKKICTKCKTSKNI
jgi:hypothetical protein